MTHTVLHVILTLHREIPNGTYPIEKLIDGAIGAAQTADEVGAESNLDFEASQPLIWPQRTILFQTDDQYIEINQTDLHTPYLGFWNSELPLFHIYTTIPCPLSNPRPPQPSTTP